MLFFVFIYHVSPGIPQRGQKHTSVFERTTQDQGTLRQGSRFPEKEVCSVLLFLLNAGS